MTIALNKEDLRWTHWRNTPTDPRPKPKAFSLSASLKALEALPAAKPYPYKPMWSRLKLDIGMSREEAHFWIEAIYKASENRVVLRDEIMAHMSRPEATYDGNIGLEKLLINLKPYNNAKNFIPTIHIIPAFVLLDIKEFVQFLDERLKLYYENDFLEEVFRLYILPYLSPEEKETFREAIRPHLERSIQSPKPPHRPELYGIAGLLGGMDTELEYYLGLYQTKLFPLIVGYHNYLLYAALGLSSRVKVEAVIRRNEIVVYKQFIKAWLAHTDIEGLDWLAYSIPNLRYSAAQNQVFKVLKSMIYPETVLPMLSLSDFGKLSPEVFQWLEMHPALVAQSLVPLVFTEHPQAAQIRNYLRHIVLEKKTTVLETEVLKLDEAQQARFRKEILF